MLKRAASSDFTTNARQMPDYYNVQTQQRDATSLEKPKQVKIQSNFKIALRGVCLR